MEVKIAIHEGGDVGSDRYDVDDAISTGILDSDGDGITGHGDDGVVLPPASNARRGGGSDGGVDDAAGNDRNDNVVVEVDDEDANDISNNGAAVAEATADAATDAKAGRMEVIDVDDEDEDEDEDEVVDDVNAGDDDGNDGGIGVPTPWRGWTPPPADPLSRSRERRGRRPPAVALQVLRRAAAQSPADDGTSSSSIRNPRGGGRHLECQRRCWR